jgi:hypothetical protein
MPDLMLTPTSIVASEKNPIGKHPFMVRGALRVAVPNPHEGDIGIDLLGRILRLAGVSRQEWDSLR